MIERLLLAAAPWRPAGRRPERSHSVRSSPARRRVRPTAVAVRAISSVSVMPVTVRSSVEMVTLTPARWSAAIGWLARSGTIPAWTFEVGQRSRVTSRARRSWRRASSSMAVTPCATRRIPKSSTSRTRCAPGTSPAWAVSASPPSRAALKAAACGGAGHSASEAGKVEPKDRRSERRRRRGRARRSRRADASALP